jgi:hypothetical protein
MGGIGWSSCFCLPLSSNGWLALVCQNYVSRSLLSTQQCFQLVFCFHHLKSEAMPSKEKHRVVLVCHMEGMDGSKRFNFALGIQGYCIALIRRLLGGLCDETH